LDHDEGQRETEVPEVLRVRGDDGLTGATGAYDDVSVCDV